MQESRRNFAKKTAIVVGATAVGTTVLASANSSTKAEVGSNGVVVGNSPKKRFYTKNLKLGKIFIIKLYKKGKLLCHKVHMMHSMRKSVEDHF